MFLCFFQEMRTEQICSSSNAYGLYSGAANFQSRPRYRITRGSSWLSSVPDTTAAVHILSNSLITVTCGAALAEVPTSPFSNSQTGTELRKCGMT
jgi:hypothetical protein